MKYTAEIFGSSWTRGPTAEFATVTEARQWAESYGNTADSCTISFNDRAIAWHRRDSDGQWHEG